VFSDRLSGQPLLLTGFTTCSTPVNNVTVRFSYIRDFQVRTPQGHGEWANTGCFMSESWQFNTIVATAKMGADWDAAINLGNSNGGSTTMSALIDGNTAIINGVNGATRAQSFPNVTGVLSNGVFNVTSASGPIMPGANGNLGTKARTTTTGTNAAGQNLINVVSTQYFHAHQALTVPGNSGMVVYSVNSPTQLQLTTNLTAAVAASATITGLNNPGPGPLAIHINLSGGSGAGSTWSTDCGVGVNATWPACPLWHNPGLGATTWHNSNAYLMNTPVSGVAGGNSLSLYGQVSNTVAANFVDYGHGNYGQVTIERNYLSPSLIGSGPWGLRGSDITCSNPTNWGSGPTANINMETGAAIPNTFNPNAPVFRRERASDRGRRNRSGC
jgi:hypothetical protein